MNASAKTVVKALRDLTALEIETRLQEIDAESQALRTLLRSVKARDRARELHGADSADRRPKKARHSKPRPPPAA